jgi:RNA polymerase sigma-70 factor (ECF subfamily)
MRAGDQPGDEKLVLLARDGNIGAFNSLVDRYQSAVYALCLRLLGNRQSAEDATQETFVSAYRAITRFEGGRLRSWLLRIAANESKDELRKRNRKERATSIDAISEVTERPFELPDTRELPDAKVERLELSAALESLLLRLPEEQRQAIVLIDVYDFPYEEVARIAGVSLGTIKSRMHRGRARLRELVLANPELLGHRRRQEA